MRSFADLAADPGPIPRDELDAFFATLAPIQPEAMLGAWRGGVFPMGTRAEAMLAGMRWYGKTFRGVNDVDALVIETDDGHRVDPQGAAVLRLVQFRGVVSAAMIYNTLPIIDHFRRIDTGSGSDAVMGIMDRKGKHDIYFHLTRDPT